MPIGAQCCSECCLDPLNVQPSADETAMESIARRDCHHHHHRHHRSGRSVDPHRPSCSSQSSSDLSSPSDSCYSFVRKALQVKNQFINNKFHSNDKLNFIHFIRNWRVLEEQSDMEEHIIDDPGLM